MSSEKKARQLECLLKKKPLWSVCQTKITKKNKLFIQEIISQVIAIEFKK